MKQEVYEAACNDRLVDYIIGLLSDCDTVTIDNDDWQCGHEDFNVYRNGELLISICDGYVNDMPNDYYVESPLGLMNLTLLLYSL